MRHLASWLLLFWVLTVPIRAAGWLDTGNDPAVVEVLNTEDNQFSFWSGPDGQEEWELNNGSISRSRVKGWQDITGLLFDLSEHRGKTVVDAELHLAKADTIPIFALVASTINTEWHESSASWRWRNRNTAQDWTFSHSDFGTASFGNYGTLVSYGYKASGTFSTYSSGGNTWVRMKLDPDLVHALILDQFGLAVTDPRGRNGNYNPRVYTREHSSSLQPRLYLKFAETMDVTPPGAVSRLSVEAGEQDGEAVLLFAAPEDPETKRALGYTVRYSTVDTFETAVEAERWRIPRPAGSGSTQRLLLEGLVPGLTYYFYLGAYDQVGNPGPIASASFTLPEQSSAPVLVDGYHWLPKPEDRVIRSVDGAMRYWACSDVAKVNPVTGNRMVDGYGEGGSDDYKKANVFWDSRSNTVMLTASRNEVIGVQLILERLGSSLRNVEVSVGDLMGPAGSMISADPNAELFLLHYVTSQGFHYADAAIPLSAPFPKMFDIPNSDHNSSGVNQSVWLDLYVPKGAVPGEYLGQIQVSADELSGPVSIGLKLKVSLVSLPDYPTFFVDLNGYGNPWNFGSDTKMTALRYFQVCHKHRMVPNTLPYGWSGSVQSDRRPQLSNSLPFSATDWSVFDEKYGWFFDGSAFSPQLSESPYVGPGADTPVATFYTPFFESWPMRVDDLAHGFDFAGQGHKHWDNKVDSGNQADLDYAWENMPDVWGSFSSTYEDSVVTVMKDWFEHAQNKGWHHTKFQTYLNHKWNFNNCAALWTLEECNVADDFRAVGYFHHLYRRGQDMADAPDVDWHFRIDISTRWVQNFGQLNDLINMSMINEGSSDWHWPNIKYRSYLISDPDDWFWYGGGHPPTESNVESARLFLKGWSQGLNGTIPYWNNFNTSWGTSETLSVLYSGQSVPGFGRYDGPIAGVRMKSMRQAQQIIELLNLLAQQEGWSRSRVTKALLDKYGDGDWGRSFSDLDEVRLYQLRSDLVAQLESFLIEGEPQEFLLPQVADSNLIRTTFLLFNVSDQAKDVSINVTGDDGSPLSFDLLEKGEFVGSTPALITLNPGATKILETRGVGTEAMTGAACISSVGEGTGVSSVFTILDGKDGFVTETGIGYSTVSSSFVMPVDTTGAFNTGVALFNPAGEVAELELFLIGLDGSLMNTRTIALAAHGHLASFVAGSDQLFPQSSDMRGTLKIESSVEIAAVVVRQNLARLNLTTLPAVPADSLATDFLLPHFADGPFPGGSMTMSFLLFNLSTQQSEVNLSFSDESGNPVNVTIEGKTSPTFQIQLSEGQAVFLETDGTGGSSGVLARGGVRVVSDHPIGVSGIFTLRDSQGVFQTETGIGTSSVRATSTIVVDNSGSFDTGVAFFNPASSSQDLTLRLFSETGELLAVADVASCGTGDSCGLRMEPGSQMARFVWEFFKDSQIERGSLAIFGSVATITLRQNSSPLSFTTMPVGEGAFNGDQD